MLNEVPNLFVEKNILNCIFRQNVALFVFFVFIIIVCKDDDFSALTNYKFINMNFEKCTMMCRMMGLIVATTKQYKLACNNPFLMNGIELSHLTNC